MMDTPFKTGEEFRDQYLKETKLIKNVIDDLEFKHLEDNEAIMLAVLNKANLMFINDKVVNSLVNKLINK